MQAECKTFCLEEYSQLYRDGYASLAIQDNEKRRQEAQRVAIKEVCIKAARKFPGTDISQIWKALYTSHVYNISGTKDDEVIKAVISADNSWKKSSGHAFEEMIRDLLNPILDEHNIRILLQKELSLLIKENTIKNDARDIKWLKEQIKSSVFDLYLAIVQDNEHLVFGCVQSKTSIRDRVTRDREPSINAMESFFMSLAVVLDGEFLRLPKFINMVNGSAAPYAKNGWHGMYVFSSGEDNDRIHHMDLAMEKLIDHIIEGSEFWLKQRQWLNSEWRPSS